jgi:hypothetical protein
MRTVFSYEKLHPRTKGKARIGPQQIESNESSPCFLRKLRNSDIGRNDEASVPLLRAGQEEMEARVDTGDADPPCVCALLCRCEVAEHRTGARWWKKESNLPDPDGCQPRLSHLTGFCAWSEYSRHPSRSRALARSADRRPNRIVLSSRSGIDRSIDTTNLRRDAGLRLADGDNYAIG